MKNNSFKVINDKGEEVTCDVLFTFDSEETNKSYVVYTDNSKDEEGNIQVFASTYNPQDENITALGPVESEKEWKIIETILDTIQEQVKKDMSNKTNEEENNDEQ